MKTFIYFDVLYFPLYMYVNYYIIIIIYGVCKSYPRSRSINTASFNEFNLHVLNTCCNFESNNRTIYKAT